MFVKSKNLKKHIKTALLELELHEIEVLEALPTCKIELSENCKTKIEEIIKRHKKQISFIALRRKIIVIIATVAVLVCTCLMSISATRKTILRYFTEITDSFTRLITQRHSYPEVIEKEYSINWLPEGYEETYRLPSKTVVDITFTNGTHTINYSQTPDISFSFVLNTEHGEIESKYIGDKHIQHVYALGQHTLVWNNDYTFFALNCDDSVPWEDIEKIILNIVPSE